MISTIISVIASVAAGPPTIATCPAGVAFPHDIRVLEVVRVLTGGDGRSHFASVPSSAETRDYLKTGKLFHQIDFGSAAKVQLVAGPPDVTFPFHASSGHEMFLTLEGGSFVTLADGTEKAILPGTLVVMDDMGSISGHGGRTGPCGYVALQIVPASVNPRKE